MFHSFASHPFLVAVLLSLLPGVSVWAAAAETERVIDVREFGAVADGKTLATKAIQAAIDQCAGAGGGTVLVPEGEFLVTQIELKSGVTLRLSKGTLLRASGRTEDYEKTGAVISATGAKNIAVEGPGTIDGGTAHFYVPKSHKPTKPGNKPWHIICMESCRNVRISDLTMLDAVTWCLYLTDCEHAMVDGVTIRNLDWGRREWTDGIDINMCRHVVVQNCDVESGDDGICLKSYWGEKLKRYRKENGGKILPHPPMFDVIVRNCTVATTCNATKIGTGTFGEVRDVLFENIHVRRHSKVPKRHRNPTRTGDCIAAISIQSNDGGEVHNIVCRNYEIESCQTPIFIQLQDRDSRGKTSLGAVHDITIDNIRCKYSFMASQINTSRAAQIQNLQLSNLDIHNMETARVSKMPKRPSGRYPEPQYNGLMPAFGLFARGVDGLRLSGQIAFYDDGKSERKMLVLDEVTGLDDAGVTGGTLPDAL